MHAFTTLVAAVLATAVAANDFIKPAAGDTVGLDSTYTVYWDPTTSGDISLILGHGTGSSFVSSFTIADGIINKNGFYTWPVSSSIDAGDNFVIKLLVDDGTNSEATYSPEFAVGTTAASSSSSSVVLSSSSASASSASSAAASAAASSVSSATASTTSESTKSSSITDSITSSISASMISVISSNSSSSSFVGFMNSTSSASHTSSSKTSASKSASGSITKTSSSHSGSASASATGAAVQGAVMWNAGTFLVAGLGGFALL